MGKTKVGVGGSQTDVTFGSNSNGSGDSTEGPAAKKRKLEAKQKNGTGSSSSNDDEFQMSMQSSGSSSPSKPDSTVEAKPSSSIGFTWEILDGNAAERCKSANLCRQRKQVERFVVPTPLNSKGKHIIIPKGNGTKLQRIQYIAQQINNARTSDLLRIHRFLFGRVGNHAEVKQHLKSFSGFPFEKNSEEYAKKKQALIKLEKPERDYFCECFGLTKSGTKDAVVDSILEFFHTPSADLVKAKPKGKEVKLSQSPKKEPKSPVVAAVVTPAKKKSPGKPKAEAKKNTVAPTVSKGKGKAAKKPAASSSPAKKAPPKTVEPKAKASPIKKGKPKASPKKGKGKAKVVIKPVFNAKKGKSSPKKAKVSPVDNDDQLKDQEDGSDGEKTDEVDENMDVDEEPEPKPKVGKGKKKSPVKPSFKKKGKPNKKEPKTKEIEQELVEEEEVEPDEEEAEEVEEEEDQDDKESNASSVD